MKIVERSYSGQLFRPKPEIYSDSGGDLLIVATPWGPRSSAKKVIQVIKDHFLASREDQEATSPFSKLTCLSKTANDLRTAVKMANDVIYNEDNKNEYISGVELFALARNASELAWVQVGYPYAYLDRPQKPLTPLGSHQDLALEYSLGPKMRPPLPSKFLGVDITSDFSTDSMRPHQHDRMILVSRSITTPEMAGLSSADRTLDNISKSFANDDADMPFWLGIVDLTSK